MLHKDIKSKVTTPSLERIGFTKETLNTYTYWEVYYKGEEKDYKEHVKQVKRDENSIEFERFGFSNN